MKKVIRIIALLITIITLLSSCDLVPLKNSYLPEGYTGGFGIPYGSGEEYYWVETYEEATEAVKLLQSHGSSFNESVIFSYEGDLFDTKYCFVMNYKKSDRITFGDNPFDRKAEGVLVRSYLFFDDVKVDDLAYSYISNYKTYGFMLNHEYVDKYGTDNLMQNEYDYCWVEAGERYHIFNSNTDTPVFILNSLGTQKSELTNECVDAILDSLVFIGTE